MSNIEQVRESISDASYALSEVGGDVDYVALLTMRERLNRLVDLEYALLTGLDEKKKKGEQAGEQEEGFITNAELDSEIPAFLWHEESTPPRRYTRKTITLTMMDGTKKVFRFADPFQ